MIYLLFLICFALSSSFAQQFYDPTDCSSDTNHTGSRYTCNSIRQSCRTFLVYRSNQHFGHQNLLNISSLFQIESDELLDFNNIASPSEILRPGREVLVPIDCLCSGQYFQASLNYIVHEKTSVSEIACGVFEGLSKSLTMFQENPSGVNDVEIGFKLHVPLRCACPDNSTSDNEVKYLVTYPLMEGDELTPLSLKFNISYEELLAANHLEPKSTVFPNTTVLVPLKSYPVLDLNIPNSPPPTPGFLPTITVGKTKNKKLRRKLYIAGSIVGFFLVIVALLACWLYVKALKRWKGERLQSFTDRNSVLSCSPARSSPRSGQTGRSTPRSGQTGRSSTTSCLSPDFLAGMKFSLYNYGIDDIKRATNDFNEGTNKIGEQVYKGLIDNESVMIKQMRFEDTRQVIDMHSKINHINIVNLHGVCYGENDFAWSYLIFELPGNGCLRNCLSNQANRLSWSQRTRIAFDIATVLHYLHYCIFPSYAHMSVNSRNIYVTSDWRAKLASIGSTLAVNSSTRNDKVVSVNALVDSEYSMYGSASVKVDIFAFGVVLLELISGQEATRGNLFKDSIGFLGGGANEGGCFEQLRNFIDPYLENDYLLAEALCLAVLAKACIEDDPLKRPSMDDILKVLGRMV